VSEHGAGFILLLAAHRKVAPRDIFLQVFFVSDQSPLRKSQYADDGISVYFRKPGNNSRQ